MAQMRYALRTPDGYVTGTAEDPSLTLESNEALWWRYSDAFKLAKAFTAQGMHVDIVGRSIHVVYSHEALQRLLAD